MIALTNVFNRLLDAYKSGDYNVIGMCGGTRSSKSWSILQLIYFICISPKNKNLLISVCSRTMPHLKRGCIRDFENILASVGNTGLVDLNKSSNIYTFTNNNKVEFWSLDDVGKIHGSQRDILFINECNYIEKGKIKQLFARTSSVKLLDWNPSNDFWINEYRDRDDYIEIHSTYKDNDFLTTEQVKEIESNKNDKYWWTVYGLGEGYVREGLCYPDVVFDEAGSHNWVSPTYGLDFGYNDPTACVRVEVDDNRIYVELVFYGKGLDVTDVKERLAVCGNDTVIADSAEPQIIRELHNSGVRIKPCTKGKNSVFEGIQLCNGYEIHCIGHVGELASEFRTYSYEQDMDGNFTDRPEDRNNHCLDAFRYAVSYLRGKKTGKYNYSFI